MDYMCPLSNRSTYTTQSNWRALLLKVGSIEQCVCLPFRVQNEFNHTQHQFLSVYSRLYVSAIIRPFIDFDRSAIIKGLMMAHI